MNSSISSNHSGAIYSFLQFVLVQNSYHGKESNNSFPYTAATTFAFSSVFILLCSPPPTHFTTPYSTVHIPNSVSPIVNPLKTITIDFLSFTNNHCIHTTKQNNLCYLFFFLRFFFTILSPNPSLSLACFRLVYLQSFYP